MTDVVLETERPWLDLRRLGTQMSVEASSDFSAAVPSSSFGPLRQIDAGLLNVGYVDTGPAEGPAVVLLHGWPYDIHSYVDVCPGLAAAGYRVIVPYLRGFGTTRFLSDETLRNGEQAALAVDVIALMDALEIETRDRGRLRLGRAHGRHRRRALAGTLHRARLGERLPDRQPEAGKMPLPPEAELQWWYQYYFATERGRAGYDKNRRDFAKLIWQTRLAEVGLRRRHLRSHRRVLRQP